MDDTRGGMELSTKQDTGAALDDASHGKSLRIRAGFDQTSKGVVSGTWTVEGTGYDRHEILAELDALSDEVLSRVREMNREGE